ncbi:MAG: hypothetical protein PHR57_02115 [Patescibacteria group bacterium]|nr:hypothetical protein [Patescibacteria group bacterium]
MQNENVQKTIRQIIDDIVSFNEKDENLLVLSVMGSFKNIDRAVDNYNDVDFFYLFKEVDDELFLRFENFLKNLISKYSNEDLEIQYSLFHGPVFKNFSKPNGILIHNIIFDVSLYRNFSSLGIFSCQNDTNALIKKIDQKEIRHIKKLNPQNIIEDMPLGLQASLMILQNKVNINGEWCRTESGNWQLSPKITESKEGELFDAIAYASFAALINFSRLIYGEKTNISKWLENVESYPELTKVIEQKKIDFLKELTLLKKQSRNKSTLDSKFLLPEKIDSLRNEGIAFVEHLIKVIKSFYAEKANK